MSSLKMLEQVIQGGNEVYNGRRTIYFNWAWCYTFFLSFSSKSTFKNVKIFLKHSKSSFNIQLQVMMISTVTYVSIRAACVKQETNEENAENRRKLNMGGTGHRPPPIGWKPKENANILSWKIHSLIGLCRLRSQPPETKENTNSFGWKLPFYAVVWKGIN